jgi:hypothetical protein
MTEYFADDPAPPEQRITDHLDCMLRMVVGGVNHQRGTCSCCSGGQDPPDPPSLSKREAARVAATYFRLHSAPGWDQ